jgi:hypothetical protein
LRDSDRAAEYVARVVDLVAFADRDEVDFVRDFAAASVGETPKLTRLTSAS